MVTAARLAVVLVSISCATLWGQEASRSANSRLRLSTAEQEWLDAHPNIRIAPDPDFAPIEWIDGSGKYQGVAADFVALIEAQLGIQFQLVALPSWDEVVKHAQARQVDVLPCVAETPERREFLSFTSTYMELPGVILTATADSDEWRLEDLEGLTVAVVDGFYWADLLRTRHPGIQLQVVPSIAEGLTQTSLGTVDAMVTDTATTTHYAEKLKLTHLHVAGRTGYSYHLRWAVRNDWPELVAILDKALQAIPPQKRGEIRHKWILRESRSQSQDSLFSGLATLSLFVALAVLVTFLVWNRALQRQDATPQAATGGADDWTDASQNRRKLLFYSVAIMAVITACVGAIATYLLYQTSFQQQRQRLVEMASAQARMIEAVARFDRVHSQNAEPGGATAATISQVVDAHQQHQSGLGITGEFAVARLEGEEMQFLLDRRHSSPTRSLRIPFHGSDLAEPMRRALMGRAGTIVATDYRGEVVLAAYEPVGELGLGIVAKIDLDEIRLPFIRAGIVALGIAALLILIGGLVLVWVNTPLIKRVEDRERRLHAVVANVIDAIFTIDSQGKILSFNPAAEATFGYQAGDILTRNVSLIIDDANGGQELDRANLMGERKQAVGRRKDGSTFPMEIAINRMGSGPAPRLVGIARDVTKQKQAQEAIERAARAAEAANLAKSEFLSHMSHELRTPLNGILGYAQIMQRATDLPSPQRRQVDAIVNCGDHLLALINDVLDLSKIEAGRMEIDLRPCDLHALIQSVGDIVQERARSKGLDFQVNVSPEVPHAIVSDAAKLRQILINLLGNAVKFTNRGSVNLRVGESPREKLQFEIRDTGVGIAPDELEHVFDTFKQVEAGKAAGGTGLGLTITKRLAEAFGGGVTVESQLGEGSTFRVTLPLIKAGTAQMATIEESESPQGELVGLAPGQSCSILVADDRETNREVLRSMLETAGFTVIVAVDGRDAINQLRDDATIELVLMDVRMPNMNGIEALERIRADESLKSMKVIAVTASVFPEFREQATSAGFDDFLAKPFRVADLFRLLAKHLDLIFETADAKPPMVRQEPPSPMNRIPNEQAIRLRKALHIKNLTAIKAVATELMDNSDTRQMGEQILEHASAFDFSRLATLLDEGEV